MVRVFRKIQLKRGLAPVMALLLFFTWGESVLPDAHGSSGDGQTSTVIDAAFDCAADGVSNPNCLPSPADESHCPIHLDHCGHSHLVQLSAGCHLLLPAGESFLSASLYLNQPVPALLGRHFRPPITQA